MYSYLGIYLTARYVDSHHLYENGFKYLIIVIRRHILGLFFAPQLKEVQSIKSLRNNVRPSGITVH